MSHSRADVLTDATARSRRPTTGIEVLGNGQTSQSDTSTGTRGFVHLTEDQGYLRVTLQVDDAGFNHFVVQVVTHAGTLTDAWLEYERNEHVKKAANLPQKIEKPP